MSEKSDALAVPGDVTMRRPTLFGVPAMPILAAPLVVRRAQVEEAGALAALLDRAFEAESWDAAGTERELFCDETVRATLVVAAEGRLVATASLQVRPDVPECGWVRGVATDLDRRREGLARGWLSVCSRWRGKQDVEKLVFIRRPIGWRRSRCICSWGSSHL
jgi:N-acetylglutamate synthase-like GNAT family acetyltransferase